MSIWPQVEISMQVLESGRIGVSTTLNQEDCSHALRVPRRLQLFLPRSSSAITPGWLRRDGNPGRTVSEWDRRGGAGGYSLLHISLPGLFLNLATAWTSSYTCAPFWRVFCPGILKSRAKTCVPPLSTPDYISRRMYTSIMPSCRGFL